MREIEHDKATGEFRLALDDDGRTVLVGKSIRELEQALERIDCMKQCNEPCKYSESAVFWSMLGIAAIAAVAVTLEAMRALVAG